MSNKIPQHIRKRMKWNERAQEFIANGLVHSIKSRANTKSKKGNGLEKFQWCRDCIGEEGITWVYASKTFYFRNEDDLFLFKLRWRNIK